MQGTIHQGRNVKRFREMLGIKQEALAAKLGGNWTQKKISILEQRKFIESPLLNRLSAVMDIPSEAFTRFNEEITRQCIKSFCKHEIDGSFKDWVENPLDKICQLYEERIALLERLLESEKQKAALMNPDYNNIRVKERRLV